MKTWYGTFKPRNPKKYKGNVEIITYRSSWEMAFMRKLDSNPDVLAWASEELAIPYLDRTKTVPRMRRYYPDFWVRKREGNKITEYIIEIKPKAQCVPPKAGPRAKKARVLKEAVTYVNNQCKWQAAEEFCAKHGFKFLVLTEDHLFKW
jgi:hypothetical protein